MATESDGAKTILCLCNGNYCRSPIAEGLLRAQLEAHGDRRFRVTSAGTTRVHEGKPPAPLTLQVIRERAAPDFTHTPHHITPGEVARADLILAMAAEHCDWIAEHYPEARARTMLLSEAIGQSFDIPDPGVDVEVTLEQIVDLIERCVRDGIDAIAARAQTRRV
jgi:protein-tyrosine phosphatase